MYKYPFWLYLLVCAGMTYLIRMLPLVLIKRRIKNKFILSMLYYMPFSVLSVMTVPAIFYSTSSVISALLGFAVALFLSYKKKSLVTVAAFSCFTVFVAEFALNNFIC